MRTSVGSWVCTSGREFVVPVRWCSVRVFEDLCLQQGGLLSGRVATQECTCVVNSGIREKGSQTRCPENSKKLAARNCLFLARLVSDNFAATPRPTASCLTPARRPPKTTRYWRRAAGGRRAGLCLRVFFRIGGTAWSASARQSNKTNIHIFV